MTQHNS